MTHQDALYICCVAIVFYVMGIFTGIVIHMIRVAKLLGRDRKQGVPEGSFVCGHGEDIAIADRQSVVDTEDDDDLDEDSYYTTDNEPSDGDDDDEHHNSDSSPPRKKHDDNPFGPDEMLR